MAEAPRAGWPAHTGLAYHPRSPAGTLPSPAPTTPEPNKSVEVFYLPAYSPELNPDEGVNGDLKQAVTRKPLARSRPELKRSVISHMRSLSKSPQRLRSLFRHPTFRYAA